jgi:hypothetical protein
MDKWYLLISEQLWLKSLLGFGVPVNQKGMDTAILINQKCHNENRNLHIFRLQSRQTDLYPQNRSLEY